MTKQHRFIILGTGGTFTLNVIKTLINLNTLPLAYFQSSKKTEPIETSFANIKLEVNEASSELSKLLALNNISVFYKSAQQIQQYIKHQNIEFLLVACWPTLIPAKVYQSVSKAAFNLHPSLLPKFRGVDPIGEQLLSKDYHFGISLHLLDTQFDTGDIIYQTAINPVKYIEKTYLEKQTAIEGAHLFTRALNSYSTPHWSPRKQKS